MKKVIIIIVIILILIVGAFIFLSPKNKQEKTENTAVEIEAEIEEEHSDIDPDVDLDLESIPLDLNDEEKAEFNENLERYNGETLNSDQAKELINKIIDINDEYVGDGKRFISIDDKNYSDTDNKLYMRCLDANPYYGGDNTKEDVEDAKVEMENFRDSLEEDANYKINVIKGRNIIVEIDIRKSKN